MPNHYYYYFDNNIGIIIEFNFCLPQKYIYIVKWELLLNARPPLFVIHDPIFMFFFQKDKLKNRIKFLMHI